MARVLGISVEELDRRERIALNAPRRATAGGFVICAADRRTEPGYDPAADDSLDARACVAAAQEHLQNFMTDSDAADAHEHIARASAMLAAAASKLAGEARDHARIASGRGLAR
jgi:hypothetical protein